MTNHWPPRKPATEETITAVWYEINKDGSTLEPSDPMPKLPEIPRGSIVVISGRAPVWRYGMAFHLLHGSPAAAVATYDPRLGAVIVASHNKEFSEGQVLDLTEGQEDL